MKLENRFLFSYFILIFQTLFCISGKGHKYFGRNVLVEGYFKQSMLHGIGCVYGFTNSNSRVPDIKPDDRSHKVSKINRID